MWTKTAWTKSQGSVITSQLAPRNNCESDPYFGLPSVWFLLCCWGSPESGAWQVAEAVLKWRKSKFKTQPNEEHTPDCRSVVPLAPGSSVWWEVTDWQNILVSQLDELGVIKKYSRCWKQKEGKRSNEVNSPAMSPSSLTVPDNKEISFEGFQYHNTTETQRKQLSSEIYHSACKFPALDRAGFICLLFYLSPI